jgi:hypothetical protein
MSKLNDLKVATLQTETGLVGSINDLEVDWLKRIRGHSGNTLNELWIQEFLAQGIPPAGFNDMAMAYLAFNGFAGTLNERWLLFWGTTPPVLPSAVIGGNGSNFGTGTQMNAPAGLPTPADWMGLTIAYLGSFGEAFWNLRLGALGNERPIGVDVVQVQLNGTNAAKLTWNVAGQKYQGGANDASLWDILSPEVGNTAGYYIVDATDNVSP